MARNDGSNVPRGDKLFLGHCPANAKWAHALVGTMGEIKYERDGWRRTVTQEDCEEALDRHLNNIQNGEIYDEESGLPHMFHILWNAGTWAHFEIGRDPSYRDPDRIQTWIEIWIERFGKQKQYYPTPPKLGGEA